MHLLAWPHSLARRCFDDLWPRPLDVGLSGMKAGVCMRVVLFPTLVG
jgi:hypothetical protein